MSHFIYCYAQCHYAQYRIQYIVTLNVSILSFIMLSVVAPEVGKRQTR